MAGWRGRETEKGNRWNRGDREEKRQVDGGREGENKRDCREREAEERVRRKETGLRGKIREGSNLALSMGLRLTWGHFFF